MHYIGYNSTIVQPRPRIIKQRHLVSQAEPLACCFHYQKFPKSCYGTFSLSSAVDSSMATCTLPAFGYCKAPFTLEIYFVTLPFRKRLQYRNSDFKRLNRINFSTILVIFGPATPQFMLLTTTPFAMIWQKSDDSSPNLYTK